MQSLNDNNALKIAVISGSRADYGLLYTTMKVLQQDLLFNLQIIVTGMHLSPEFGNTFKIFEQDGFSINAKVDMLLSGDSSTAIGKSIGLGVIGFVDALNVLSTDLILVLGDRFEIFAAVQAALILKIPVVHIAGGDTTEGAFDESMRHSITKMAHLHFTTNAQAAERVKQLGENPEHVFTVGSPGIDLIKSTALLSKQELATALQISLNNKYLLITFHPATLDNTDIEQQCSELFTALDHFGSQYSLIFTKSNADTAGRTINQIIEEFVKQRAHAHVITSMGQHIFYSAVAHADAVVGNSSSGLYEAPSLKTPTVNIGDRQKGRARADSVVDCAVNHKEIIQAIETAVQLDCRDTVNPYGDGNATEKIVNILQQYTDRDLLQSLLKKRFFIYDKQQ